MKKIKLELDFEELTALLFCVGQQYQRTKKVYKNNDWADQDMLFLMELLRKLINELKKFIDDLLII